MDSLHKSPPQRPPAPAEPQAGYPAYPYLPPETAPDAVTPAPQGSPRRLQSIILGICGIALFLLIAAVGFFLYKGLSAGRSIQLDNIRSTSFFADMKHLATSLIQDKKRFLRGEKEGRINILLIGRAGERYPGRNLTDTVMVMSIDTQSRKIALLSLPRDLYAPVPDTVFSTKLNSLYQYGLSNQVGIDPLRASVETITGQKIDYFFILDFDGFEKAIDALGGSTALKYVRERHNDPEGDFGRAKRQQQVIQSIKDKAFSLGTFLNIFAVNDLFDALGESVKTDMSLDAMEGFLRLAKTLDTENITSIVIDAWQKESLLRVSHIQVGPIAAFILVPRTGNWNEIRDVSENIFRLDELKARHNRIASEQSTLTIIALPADALVAQKMKRLAIEEMEFSAVSLIPLSVLENRPEKSMLVDRSSLEKPFSLDELLKKFALTKADRLAVPLPAADTSDFVIVIGADLADTLSFDEDTSGIIPDDSAFPEALPPQPRSGKN